MEGDTELGSHLWRRPGPRHHTPAARIPKVVLTNTPSMFDAALRRRSVGGPDVQRPITGSLSYPHTNTPNSLGNSSRSSKGVELAFKIAIEFLHQNGYDYDLLSHPSRTFVVLGTRCDKLALSKSGTGCL